jgi:hypothetical protein
LCLLHTSKKKLIFHFVIVSKHIISIKVKKRLKKNIREKTLFKACYNSAAETQLIENHLKIN